MAKTCRKCGGELNKGNVQVVRRPGRRLFRIHRACPKSPGQMEGAAIDKVREEVQIERLHNRFHADTLVLVFLKEGIYCFVEGHGTAKKISQEEADKLQADFKALGLEGVRELKVTDDDFALCGLKIEGDTPAATPGMPSRTLQVVKRKGIEAEGVLEDVATRQPPSFGDYRFFVQPASIEKLRKYMGKGDAWMFGFASNWSMGVNVEIVPVLAEVAEANPDAIAQFVEVEFKVVE